MNRNTYASKVEAAIRDAVTAHPDQFKTLSGVLDGTKIAWSNGWPLKGGAAGYQIAPDAVNTPFDRILPHQQDAGQQDTLTIILNPRTPSRNLGALVAGALIHTVLVVKRSSMNAQKQPQPGGGFEIFTPDAGPQKGQGVLRSFSPTRLAEFKDAMSELGCVRTATPVNPKDKTSPKVVSYHSEGALTKILQKVGKVTEGPVNLNIPEAKPSRSITVQLPTTEEKPLRLVTGNVLAAVAVARAIPGSFLLVNTSDQAEGIRNTHAVDVRLKAEQAAEAAEAA